MLELRESNPRELVLRGVDRSIAACLRKVPAILEHRDSAAMHERFHPRAFPNDPERQLEWERLMDSDLRHLFEAAVDTFRRDVGHLDARRGVIVFPADHLRAWMSAINQARILLAEHHRLDEQDFERIDLDPGSPRDAALAHVQLLGYVLQVLVEHGLEGA